LLSVRRGQHSVTVGIVAALGKKTRNTMGLAHRAKAKDPLRGVAASRSNMRCEATYGEWGDYSARRCEEKAEDIFIVPETKAYVAMCEDCRLRALGPTNGERMKRIKANKLAQTSLLTVDHKKEKHQ